MERFRLRLQVVVLAIGTAFAWYTLVDDYRRFFSAGGGLFEFSGCAETNPLLTPCFYGALAFLAALVWALALLRSGPEIAARHQRGLDRLLAAGTVFAWGNFAYEMYRFSEELPPSRFGCPPPGQAAVHPMMMPCYYGAWIFLAALLISRSILRDRSAYDRRNDHV